VLTLKTNDLSQLGALIKTSSGQDSVVNAGQSKKEKNSRHKRLKNHNTGGELPFSKSAQEPLKNEFVLRRDIEVVCWNVKATISKASKRDELIPVLKRAQENSGTDGRDIACHLLGEEIGREVVGFRLLAICESLGLLESSKEQNRLRYLLTNEGKKALESGSVMVPEEGTWTIWASNDALLNHPVLYIEPFREGSVFDEICGDKRKETKDRNDKFKSLPSWLRDACSITAIPAAIGNELIRLDHIDTKIELIENNASLALEWIPEVKSLKIKGSIKNQPVDATPEAPDVSFNDVWQELLENEKLWPYWEESKERLLTSFTSTNSAERSLMKRQLELAKPRLDKFGSFELTRRTVAIFPQSYGDAKEWAEWKLQSLIKTYAIKAEFTRWRQQALQPFEKYSEVIALPTRSEIAIDVWKKRRSQQGTSNIWHLVAVEDWGI
jgi:hypothetical protein